LSPVSEVGAGRGLDRDDELARIGGAARRRRRSGRGFRWSPPGSDRGDVVGVHRGLAFAGELDGVEHAERRGAAVTGNTAGTMSG